VAFDVTVSWSQQLPAAGDALAACDVTYCWLPVGTPKAVIVGAYRAIEVNYSNFASIYNMGIVFMVVHNSQGQNVEWSTCTIGIAQGGIGTAELVAFGLESGTYSATLFVVYPSGIAMSPSTTVTFSV